MRRLIIATFIALPVAVPAHAQELQCAVPAPAGPPERTQELNEIHRIATGEGVKVAVIDTGVSRHRELPRLTAGDDFVGDEPFHDCDAHGTAVAGIIGGVSNGVAPGAEILAIRQSSGTEGGNLETLEKAIHNAVDEGARVINMSVVSCVDPEVDVDTRGLRGALDRAERHGAVVVAAAGNATSDCEPGARVYPAHLPTVLAVGARADSHTLADYSLPVPEGQKQLSAPGKPGIVLSADGRGWAAGVTGQRRDVQRYEGTSFAAPVVSATAALLAQRYPEASPKQIRGIIEGSAQHGGGAVDPLAALTHVERDVSEEDEPLKVRAIEEPAPQAPIRGGAAALALVLALCAVIVAGSVSRSPSWRRRG